MAATLKTDTRQLIIDSTIELIAKRDVNEISLADIAAAAKITKGTLFYYYNSKDLIFVDITYQYLTGLASRFEEWVNNAEKDTSLPRMAKYILDFGARYDQRSKLHIYLVNKALSDNKQLKTIFRKTYIEWREMIKNHIAERISDPEKAVNIANLLLVMVDGIIVQDLIGVKGIETSDIISLLIK
jgi:AcrR family transcriptional regulator